MKKIIFQKPSNNKPPGITEEIIVKYADDANLFRLGSTNPKKTPAPVFLGFYTGGLLLGWAFVRGLFVVGILT